MLGRFCATTLAAVMLGTPGLAAASDVTQTEPPRCFGARATIVGTDAPEDISGTSDPDVIVGGGGSDRIWGLGGDDRICVGLEIDPPTGQWVRAGGGDDLVRGAAHMYGGLGDDYLYSPPRSKNRSLDGGRGDDMMFAPSTAASHYGGSFRPGPGRDTVDSRGAHRGDLFYTYATGPVVVDLRRGIATGEGHDVLRHISFVWGTRRDDVLLGDSRGNVLWGGRGDDVIRSRGGRDLIDGFAGDDVIVGGAGGDVELRGRFGDDVVMGGPGDDRMLDGGFGRDTISGGGGDDRLYERLRPERNVIDGGRGDDTCYGGYQVPPNIEVACESSREP